MDFTTFTGLQKDMSQEKKYKRQIPGEFGRAVFMSEEEFEEGYKRSIFWTDSKFMDEYRKHMAGMSHVAECAKIYIYKNWEKVQDWSALEVIVIHGPSGEATEYYNHEHYLSLQEDRKKKREERAKKRGLNKVSKNSIIDDIFEEMEREKKEKHNPVKSIDRVVLDPTDGDFSLTINGKEHWWIQDEAVIIIADYIEKQLKSNTDEEVKSH